MDLSDGLKGLSYVGYLSVQNFVTSPFEGKKDQNIARLAELCAIATVAAGGKSVSGIHRAGG